MSSLKHELFLDLNQTTQFTNEPLQRGANKYDCAISTTMLSKCITDELCITLFSFFNLNMRDSPGEKNGQCNGEGRKYCLF